MPWCGMPGRGGRHARGEADDARAACWLRVHGDGTGRSAMLRLVDGRGRDVRRGRWRARVAEQSGARRPGLDGMWPCGAGDRTGREQWMLCRRPVRGRGWPCT